MNQGQNVCSFRRIDNSFQPRVFRNEAARSTFSAYYVLYFFLYPLSPQVLIKLSLATGRMFSGATERSWNSTVYLASYMHIGYTSCSC